MTFRLGFLAWLFISETGRGTAQGVSENKLSNARMPKVRTENRYNTAPKTRKRACATGVPHDFYTIISLSSLCERFHSPREGCLSPTGKTGYAAKQQKIQKTPSACQHASGVLNFELSAYTRILFFLSGASLLEAAEMNPSQSVR